MANGKQDVLSEQDLSRINTALTQLERAKQVIDLATQAGLDVQALDERHKSSRDQLLRIKNTFFPGR
jgi:DNA-binding phage protein